MIMEQRIANYADFQEAGLVPRRFNHIFTGAAGRRNMKDPQVTGRGLRLPLGHVCRLFISGIRRLHMLVDTLTSKGNWVRR